MKTRVTQSELQELLHYNEETGEFTWKETRGGMTKGSIAGSIAKRGYVVIRIHKRIYYAHRMAWLYMHGAWPSTAIDHINHDKTDNRLCNLRTVTHQENARNQHISKKNTSGHIGVSWRGDRSRWKAQIKVDYKVIYLGTYKDIDNAVTARKEAEKKYGFHENHGK